MRKLFLIGTAVLLALLACKREAPLAEDAGSPPARRVRPASAAGRYYPGDPDEVARTVGALLAAQQRTVHGEVPMVLVPHAGYVFSGAVAAAAFRQVQPGFERAVIIAANHNGQAHFGGVSIDRSTHLAIPGEEIPVAVEVADQLLRRPLFVDVPAAHVDHMAEVELPFLRALAGPARFEVLSLVVGRLTREQTRQVAEALHGLVDPARPGKTLFVFSVDLSHYYPAKTGEALDRACLDALVRMNADRVARCDTDGTQVLMVMTELAAALQASPRLLRYAHSGEVTKDDSGVVGYGAMAYERVYELTRDEREALLVLARRSVEAAVKEGRVIAVPPEVTWSFPRLRVERGAFVTLKRKGALRGCIGSLAPERPLAEDVAQNAFRAALRDPRFPPVAPEELPALDLSISVLDLPSPVEPQEPDALLQWLGEKRPGLVLEVGGRRSTFLPEVWEELPQPALFLGQLCRKQGSPVDCWRQAGARLSQYGAIHFAEGGGQ